MTHWKNDEELFRAIRAELSTCPISDVLSLFGLADQVLPPGIKPLAREMVVLGRAMPVLDKPPVTDADPRPRGSKPFGLLLESIEALQPNDVYIAGGGPVDVARIGDMLALRAQLRGASGIVLHAHVRDVNNLLKIRIPTFCLGSYAYGLQGRHNVVDYRCPIEIGRVRVRVGDIVFGDADGVCVIPQNIERDVVAAALQKSRAEAAVLEMVRAGASIVDAFAKHGAI